MTKVEERITNNVQNNGVLMEFLGADNVDRLKKRNYRRYYPSGIRRSI